MVEVCDAVPFGSKVYFFSARRAGDRNGRRGHSGRLPAARIRPVRPRQPHGAPARGHSAAAPHPAAGHAAGQARPRRELPPRKARHGRLPARSPTSGWKCSSSRRNMPLTAARSCSSSRLTAASTSASWSRASPPCCAPASSCGRSACATRRRWSAASASAAARSAAASSWTISSRCPSRWPRRRTSA